MTGFSQTDTNFVISRNEDYSETNADGIRITVLDVYSRAWELRRRVVIFDSINNVDIGEANIKLVSTPSFGYGNIYDKVNYDSTHFSGILTIEIGDAVAYTLTIENGVAQRQTGELPGPVYNAGLTCTFGHVHDCVAYNIEGMSWVRYTICLFFAPHCYILEWLDCQWQVCHNHMQYTNPN